MSLSENQRVLLIKFLDRQVDVAEEKTVNKLLLESQAARSFLREVAEQAVVIGDVERARVAQANGRTSRLPTPALTPNMTWTMIGAFASLAACIAALASYTTYQWSRQNETIVAPIAHVTEFGGRLLWIGNGGIVNDGLAFGDPLEGGTLECFANSWATVEMTDGSEITVVGPAELTMSDNGQKVLYLDGGKLSADVAKQPIGAPMVIHTAAARMEVLGTQLNVDAQSVSTMLTVNEGNVRMTRLVDGADCEVKAQHQALATFDHSNSLESKLRSKPVDRWSVDFAAEPKSFFGKWMPAAGEVAGRLRTVPLLWTSSAQDKSLLIHVAWVPCEEIGEEHSAPIVLKSNGVFRVTGHIDESKDAPFFFLIKTSSLQGGFAGNYLMMVDREKRILHDNGSWSIELPVAKFIPDPENENLKQTEEIETYSSPVGLQLTEFMGISITEDIGLEILSADLRLNDSK